MPTMEALGRVIGSIRRSANHVTDSVRQLIQRQSQNNEMTENVEVTQTSVTSGQATDSDLNDPSTSIHSLPPHYDDVSVLQPASSYHPFYRLSGVARSASMGNLSNTRLPAYASQDAPPPYSSVRELPQRGNARTTWRSISTCFL